MPPPRVLFRSADLGGGLRLHLHRTRAFKSVSVRLVFHANLDAGSPARAMVPRVLGRGTRRYPTLRELQAALDGRFGASLGGEARKMGERQLVVVRADWVADRYVARPLLREMAGLIGEFLHEPAADADGGLRAAVVEQERKMQADEAASILDDKARYARHRLIEVMCRRERYARTAIGSPAEISALRVDAV
ncbi:MAG: hypothetical protein ACREID_01645, partial [Planctomycetota bacterium]